MIKYSFNLVGVSPVLHFFHHQPQSLVKPQHQGIEDLGTHTCTLDTFLASIEPVPVKWGWNLDQVVDTVIEFWMNNAESINYWKSRLNDAGHDSLLVARVADMNSLSEELESLLGKNL